jgi:hypothetical protein
MPLIAHYLERESGSTNARLGRVLTERVWGVEIDPEMYERAIARITGRWGPLPHDHNLALGDYFRWDAGMQRFAAIIGNPPFGGTFDPSIEDELDRRYGRYGGSKLKKETYAFFIAKALDELALDGELAFICSDTFLTIKTMAGLRKLLIDRGQPTVERLTNFSDETSYDMVTLRLHARPPASSAIVMGAEIGRSAMESTGNYSWTVGEGEAQLFAGPCIGDLLVATGGMTIGRNELFLRELRDGAIDEHLEFAFGSELITLEGELSRARLGKLSPRRRQAIAAQVARSESRRVLITTERAAPVRVDLPCEDYRYYNKASGARLYSPPAHAIFWKDEGDAVLTFKRSGPWYLHGVGGGPYFGREGITWQLVAPRINARYLPPGYILDSGAPCAFTREGTSADELWFILGWLQTALATNLLKTVINHIQGKDVERLPYPWWVSPADKAAVIGIVRDAIRRLQLGETIEHGSIQRQLTDLLKPELESRALAA